MASTGFIRILHLILRILQVCTAAIVLGIFSYFLAVLADHDLHIEPWAAAVEGISGAATLYTLLASIFITLTGRAFFAGLAMLFDLLFGAAFIAIAVMARDGTQSCSGDVKTPLGQGDAGGNTPGFGDQGFGVGDGQNITYMPNLGLACRLQKAALAVSIIGVFLFFISIFVQRAYAQSSKATRTEAAANKPSIGPKNRRAGWKFWQKKDTTDPYNTTSDYHQEPSSPGSFPMTKQPSLESKPPRYTGIFGRSHKKESDAKESQTATPSTNINSPAAGQVDSDYGYGYGYRSAYRNDTSPYPDPPYPDTWSSNNYADYSYGPSGIDGVGTSHGYGV